MRLFIVVLVCLVRIDSFAQSTKPAVYALVVGVSEYREITPLQYADRDALAFAQLLKTQHVPQDNIKLFLNQEATRLNIVDEFYNLTQALKPHDRFYFYFGGHGDLEANIGAENALLLLYNSYKTGYFKGNEFLQLSELKAWFDALTQKQVEVIFIADACHSGGLIGGQQGISKIQQALQESWGSTTKILSCQADEFSLEGKQWGGGRGLFSYHLVNGLTGRADANQDQQVSLGELTTYLTQTVLREANPNVQTPVVSGSTVQVLSLVSAEGLAQLADDEAKRFPIITEVNLKGGEEKANAELVSRLDTSLVSVYKRFSKALKEKRVASYDDSTDNALLYYHKLTAHKIPANLVQLMKRNLAVGLLERELEVMKGAREKGQGYIVSNEKVLTSAIANLETTMKLFGSDHYFYRYLQARKVILETQLPPKSYPTFAHSNTVDKNIQDRKEFVRKATLRRKELLLKGLDLEPNMISTYVLLSTTYRANQQLDSALYYQEKVVELLPNQGYAYYNLAMNYQAMKYVDNQNRPAPHPQAIQYFEKAIEVEPTLIQAYYMLANLHMGEGFDKANRNYAKAISYVEKIVAPQEVKDQEFIKKGVTKVQDYDDSSPYSGTFHTLIGNWTRLYFLHKATGNTAKAENYLNKLHQKADMGQSAYSYLAVAFEVGRLLLAELEEDDDYVKTVLDFQLKALKKREEELSVATAEDKPLLSLKYREQLKGIGGTYRALNNYPKADHFYQQAIAYTVLESPILPHLKLTGSQSYLYKGRTIPLSFSWGVHKKPNGDYYYAIDVYSELFLSKWEQNKPDEAFAWLEKSFQVSAAEHGNDVSGKPFEEEVFEYYKNMDKARFLALKAKYFPIPSTQTK